MFSEVIVVGCTGSSTRASQLGSCPSLYVVVFVVLGDFFGVVELVCKSGCSILLPPTWARDASGDPREVRVTSVSDLHIYTPCLYVLNHL